jgi:hypothetical protein
MLEYFARLKPGGLFSMTRGDLAKRPMQVERLTSTIVEALSRVGIENPARHVVITLSGGESKELSIFNILARLTPFAPHEIERLKAHLAAEGFKSWHLPGETRARNRNLKAILYRAPEKRREFLADQGMNLAPTTDDEPFFFNFFKWKTLVLLRNPFSDYTPVTGQLVLLAILAQSIIFGSLLIIGPLFRRSLARSVRQTAHRYRSLLYFGCLGIGFMFIEISYIQRFTLFLGSPVFSLSVVLASLLFFTGGGSLLSGRMERFSNTGSALRLLGAALCVLNLLYIVALPTIFEMFLGIPLGVRIAVAVLLLMPAGLIMGGFFPLGMRVLTARAPELIPWAWAVNGVMGVTGSILCIVLAISLGFRAVNLIALGIYLLGLAAMLKPAGSLGQTEAS